MAWNFRKRITILPGLRLNLSSGGVSVSVGPRGANLNIGKQGITANTSIPGTGLYKREKLTSTPQKKGRKGIIQSPAIDTINATETSNNTTTFPKSTSFQKVRIETLLKYRNVIKESKVDLLEALANEGDKFVIVPVGEIEALAKLQKSGSSVKRIISFKECSDK